MRSTEVITAALAEVNKKLQIMNVFPINPAEDLEKFAATENSRVKLEVIKVTLEWVLQEDN